MTCFLPQEALVPWLDEVERTHTVFAPIREGTRIVFRQRSNEHGARPICLTQRPDESARHLFFPHAEALFAYRCGSQKSVELFEAEPPRPFLALGLRECDAQGVAVVDSAFMEGKVVDPLYAARRRAALIAVIECVPGNGPDNACFCHWFKRTDDGTADLRLAPQEDGFLVRAVSSAGEAFLRAHGNGLVPANEKQHKAAQDAREATLAFLASRAPVPDMSGVAETIRSSFGNADLWRDLGETCLSCRACTHLCPACYCFTITDETRGTTGARIRSWDACMNAGYTLEASGHNPRTAKTARMRNRLAHKFAYYPALHEGRQSCTGCGRCVRVCPAGLDIRKAIRRLAAHPLMPDESGQS